MTGDPFLVLRVEYLQGARTRVAELHTLVKAAADEGEARVQLRRLAHNLRGSGAFFGFPGITTAAEALEALVESLQAGEPPTPGELTAAADALVQALYMARVPGVPT